MSASIYHVSRYAFQTEDKLYMVMDYVRGGELYQHLKKFKFFEPQRAWDDDGTLKNP